MLLELTDNSLRQINGDGKADPLALGNNGGVDANDFPIHVQQRSTAVSRVDRRIGLDKIIIGPAADHPTLGADNPGGYRLLQTKRTADGHHPAAHRQLIRIAQLQRGQIRRTFNSDQG